MTAPHHKVHTELHGKDDSQESQDAGLEFLFVNTSRSHVLFLLSAAALF